jgi:hypothetical protein
VNVLNAGNAGAPLSVGVEPSNVVEGEIKAAGTKEVDRQEPLSVVMIWKDEVESSTLSSGSDNSSSNSSSTIIQIPWDAELRCSYW